MSTIQYGHDKIDARSLALGQLVARRLQERPELLGVARKNLERWRRGCASSVQATLAEWETIIDGGLEATAAVLTGRDERSVRLRQSTPFAGEEMITRAERNRIFQQFPR